LIKRFGNDGKEHLSKLLKHLIQGKPPSEFPDWGKLSWGKLNPKTQECVTKISDAARITACLERAGINPSNYYVERKRAEQLGVMKAFDEYIGWSVPLPEGPPPFGTLAPHFYVPRPNVLAFREAALETRRKLAEDGQRNPYVNRLPGYLQWLWSWTVPPSRKGVGRILPSAGEIAASESGRHNCQNGNVTFKNVIVENLTAKTFNNTGGQKENSPAARFDSADPDRVANHIGNVSPADPGRQPTNDDVVTFFLDLRKKNPKLRAKEILKQFKAQVPDHPIFKAKNPAEALRVAISRRTKKRKNFVTK
jgi:hypothetical protein